MSVETTGLLKSQSSTLNEDPSHQVPTEAEWPHMLPLLDSPKDVPLPTFYEKIVTERVKIKGLNKVQSVITKYKNSQISIENHSLHKEQGRS